jgi:hypothetical protein
MAVIKCPGCGSNVSDLARECAKCGFEINRMNPYLMMALWFSLIAGVIFAMDYTIG